MTTKLIPDKTMKKLRTKLQEQIDRAYNEEKLNCKHTFKIFNDPDLKGTGFLSFYCQNCLLLVKKKKAYGNGEEKR